MHPSLPPSVDILHPEYFVQTRGLHGTLMPFVNIVRPEAYYPTSERTMALVSTPGLAPSK
jgi:hypothetical protein